MRYCTAICIVFILLTASAFPLSYWSSNEAWGGDAIEDRCYQRSSDTLGGLWLVHSNRMALGRPFVDAGVYGDDNELTANLPFSFDANFPGGSSGQYLYAAGLWVGGVKGADTMVVQAFDYVAPVPEFFPSACPDGELTTFSELADVEHVAVAYDSPVVGDSLFRCQIGDCRDWYPLGLCVTSHSYTWSSPPYDDIVMVEYVIVNIDTLPITDGWVGIYADCDVGGQGETATYPTGDISGYIDGIWDGEGGWQSVDLAYTLDAFGDPGKNGIDGNSANGAFGVQILGLSVPEYSVNFNWWAYDKATSFEWGPRQDEQPLRDLGGESVVAIGDHNKYYLMSHAEVDYDQIQSGLTHPGWLDPGSDGILAARGEDTRFLLSAGPFDLAPQEQVIFTVAYLAADEIISNDYISYWFNAGNPMSVSDYYELMDMEALYETARSAIRLYENGPTYPAPGMPQGFELTAYDDNFVSFAWRPRPEVDLAGYRLRGRRLDDDSLELIFELTAADTAVSADGLDGAATYEFHLTAFDAGGAEGRPTGTVMVCPGGPHPPETVTAITDQVYPLLSWSRIVDEGVVEYRVYRQSASVTSPVLLTATTDTSCIDWQAVPGSEYFYSVKAVNDAGVASYPSRSLRVIPMQFTSGILVLDCNRGDLIANLAYDRALLPSLLATSLYDFEYAYRAFDVASPPTLHALSEYSLLIIAAENRFGSLPSSLERLLPLYLDGGGKVLFLLRHVGVDVISEAEPNIIRFHPGAFFREYLHIDSSYIGPTVVNGDYRLAGDCLGAQPTEATYPALHWDSLLANQFAYSFDDGLPYCGVVWSQPDVTPLYRYVSVNPDSLTDDQVSGLLYQTDRYACCLLNMPLSLMQVDSAAALLLQLVDNLDAEFICGDVNRDFRVNVGDVVSYIRHLYYDETPENLTVAGDVNCDGLYDMLDLLTLINYYMGRGLAPGCCR